MILEFNAGLRNQHVLEFLESPSFVLYSEPSNDCEIVASVYGRRGQTEVTVHVFGEAPTGTRLVVRIGYQSCGAVPLGGLSGGVS